MDFINASLEVFGSLIAGCLTTFLVLKGLSKTGRHGWMWGIPASALILFVMFLVWFVIVGYDNQSACEVAYGAQATSDPDVCDNPANGIMMMLEYPFIVTGWVVMTLVTFYRLSARKRLAPQRTPQSTSW